MKIGILGYGTVASGLVDIIDSNKDKRDITIEGILVRDVDKYSHKKHADVLTSNIDDIFAKDIDVMVELLGGLHPAYEYLKKAIENKINIVTANKDMLAEFGAELVKLAKENGVCIKFEASVGGGIPVIKPLIESLEGNEINSISAILNGTTNFILSKMYDEDLSYEQALKQAQELGFAEANPEADVMGYDAGRKLSILSTLSYNKRIYWKDFYLEGIDKIEHKDIEYAKKLGCKIKLVGQSKLKDGKVNGFVRPVLIDNDNIMSKIDNEFNIIVANGDFLGDVSFVGKGAGKDATGSAVYADVLDIYDKRINNVDAFMQEKISVDKLVSSECKALLRFKKPQQKEKIISVLKENLIDSEVIAQDDELAVMVDASSECAINDSLKVIQDNNYCEDMSKILKLSL
ncbi:MAG: homoserine dehydrogenase [Intestinibacter sp.]|uniref:homoserine dehydrogenase n=1 Tax=Intestinibacter sp. TaxID=1965304 RepID=UPI0025C067CC|nr:homoserine dehydrogenase [Intestinibacter sp.]MCI6737699.1 homoserine dehydrogenase [Intestinibacter sp.]